MDARPVAVYDANVLYPAQLRDLLLRLAVNDLVRPHWSDEIHDEWTRNVHADRPSVTWEDLEYTRGEMERAFPDASVDGYQDHIDTLSLPDPDDRHVLAAAIEVGADYIVTFVLGDFPAAQLDPHGVEVVDPDSFACLLMDRDLEGVLGVAAEHRGSLRKPPLGAGEYLEALRNAGLEVAAERLENYRTRL
jgi:predicted nucleic acid-binding protein